MPKIQRVRNITNINDKFILALGMNSPDFNKIFLVNSCEKIELDIVVRVRIKKIKIFFILLVKINQNELL